MTRVNTLEVKVLEQFVCDQVRPRRAAVSLSHSMSGRVKAVPLLIEHLFGLGTARRAIAAVLVIERFGGCIEGKVAILRHAYKSDTITRRDPGPVFVEEPNLEVHYKQTSSRKLNSKVPKRVGLCKPKMAGASSGVRLS